MADIGFEVDEVVLPNGVSILDGSADPSVALIDRPVGSAYYRTNGQLWIKTGALPNQWTRSTSSSVDVSSIHAFAAAHG